MRAKGLLSVDPNTQRSKTSMLIVGLRVHKFEDLTDIDLERVPKVANRIVGLSSAYHQY